MSSEPNPSGKRQDRPPRRHWEARIRPHWLEFALGVGLLIVGGAQVVIYLRQASIMQSQSDILAQQTLIAQAEHRPWVSANPIELIGMDHTNDGLTITLQFTLKNSGHSPAKHAFHGLIAKLLPHSKNAWEQVCEETDRRMVGLNIFPGDTVIQGVAYNIPESDFNEVRAQADQSNGGKIPGILPTIIACISYRDMETKTLHRTPYERILMFPDKKGGSPLEMLMNHGPVPAGSVGLGIFPIEAPPD